MVPNLTHGGRPWMVVENVVQLLSGKARTEAHAFYFACGFEPVAEGFKRYLQ